MIVVTGSMQGIGLAAARALAATGHRLLLAGRDEAAGAQAAAEIAGADYMCCDVAEDADCRALVDKAVDLGDGVMACVAERTRKAA